MTENPAQLQENSLDLGLGPEWRHPELDPADPLDPLKCIAGHPLDGDNLYVTPDGRRQCRVCLARRQREFQAKRRAEA